MQKKVDQKFILVNNHVLYIGTLPLNGFTVSQLERMISNSKPNPENSLSVAISALESYFSASLIFHASNQAINNLRWQNSSPLAVDAGEFTAKTPFEKGLEVRVKMHLQEDEIDGNLPRWRLQLKVAPDSDSSSSEGAAELSSKIEEFFRRRVSDLLKGFMHSSFPCLFEKYKHPNDQQKS